MGPPADQSWQWEAPCGMLITDARGKVLRANATLSRWLGYAESEMAQFQLAQLLTVGGRLFHQTHLAPLLQMQGSVAEVQLQLRHRDGQALPVLAAIERGADAEGNRVDHHAFMVAADRRKYEQELLGARQRAEAALEERRAALESLRQKELELRKANEQLKLIDLRKDEFLAVLAHELRNPLTPMRSGLDLLAMRNNQDPVVQRVLGVFDRQVALMSRLVEDLMDVSRIGKGKLQLKREPVLVSMLVRHAVELATPLFSKASQTLHVAAGADCTLDGDPVRLTQMLVNLLNNASKYTHAGGSAWIRFERQENEAVITIRDTGIGLEPERLSEVFTLFSQVDSATERAQGGIGIGLGLVKGIVELHGGAVSAHSAGLGHGSEFVVRLPVAATPPGALTPAERSTQSAG
ncbi:HAMP domain-containing histidine kinase [Massilia sp. PAMC28688]|uniref:PAS domain-containing sensor histidine kinase n=1 Tax=Massilia sp. PAMC28688 TaxID=2861283 RepID=UPI001C639938|nr:HAMP domain-containing sensor histidine kinase [Massilia sp. PAMC28688]QYF92595.1 HAMP domain-containing histidine kinase [Massilia sp. PAMC28688]